jgi:hypothetical protein
MLYCIIEINSTRWFQTESKKFCFLEDFTEGFLSTATFAFSATRAKKYTTEDEAQRVINNFCFPGRYKVLAIKNC